MGKYFQKKIANFAEIFRQRIMSTKSNLTLKSWADEDKPREKLLNGSPKDLSKAELLAILLQSGQPGQNVVDLAKEILDAANGSLLELSKHRISDLMAHKGIGEAKAVTIAAAMELGLRLYSESSQHEEPCIRNSGDLFNYIVTKVADLPHEEFWAVYLNIRNKILGCSCISRGGLCDTAVDIRLIFQMALERKAVAIAVVHNHPSGSLEPSKKDKALTDNIIEAGKILRIPLMEHLIVGITEQGKPDYYSFHDNGLI